MPAAAEVPLSNDQLVDSLAEQGWVVCPQFLSSHEWLPLLHRAQALHAEQLMRPAQIGSGAQRQRRSDIRSDEVLWIDQLDATTRVYWERMEALRLQLNQALYLGLERLEAHWAAFAAGSYYRRHRDQFQGGRQRVVSCIFYLNEDWASEDGGQLRMYLENHDRPLDVLPQGGTLVAFLSEHIEHEVLAARRNRYSITGWLRRRDDLPV
nr:2OG-Fe(II) oxygenase [Oceanococcus sp. HetDA_MAG_MS8]